MAAFVGFTNGVSLGATTYFSFCRSELQLVAGLAGPRDVLFAFPRLLLMLIRRTQG